MATGFFSDWDCGSVAREVENFTAHREEWEAFGGVGGGLGWCAYRVLQVGGPSKNPAISVR